MKFVLTIRDNGDGHDACALYKVEESLNIDELFKEFLEKNKHPTKQQFKEFQDNLQKKSKKKLRDTRVITDEAQDYYNNLQKLKKEIKGKFLYLDEAFWEFLVTEGKAERVEYEDFWIHQFYQ